MFNLNDKLKKKFFLIYGYGKSGQSAYNYLKNNNKIVVYDDHKKIKNFSIPLKKNKIDRI